MEDIRGFVAESWDDIKSPTTSDFTSKIHQLKDLVGNYDQVCVSPTLSHMSCISSWLLGSFGLQAFVIATTFDHYIHYKEYKNIHFFLGGWHTCTYIHCMMMIPQINWKICLKSAGLHESFGWCWLILCCVVWRQLTIETMPQLWWSV